MTPPHDDLSRSLFFAGNTPVEGALSALALAPLIDGRQPHSCAAELHEVAADATLLPPGVPPERSHDENGLRSHLATGPGWTLLAMRLRGRSATVRVCAETEALAREVLGLATATAQCSAPVGAAAVPIGFWHDVPGRTTGVRTPRTIDVPDWAAIRGNYAAAPAAALDALMATGPDAITGRLVLMHGPTGTGKTTALRALAREWRTWCQVECVLDPDALLANPAYLMSVALGDPGTAPSRWRLLVLEDCDELVRADAKRGTGQALSRLLNLTDGLLGQGLDVLVCLTTNEDVARLHPAVVRPGRCLAEIEVGPLPPDEARRWLAGDAAGDGAGIGPDGATLAELFRRRGDVTTVRHVREPVRVGTYL